MRLAVVTGRAECLSVENLVAQLRRNRGGDDVVDRQVLLALTARAPITVPFQDRLTPPRIFRPFAPERIVVFASKSDARQCVSVLFDPSTQGHIPSRLLAWSFVPIRCLHRHARSRTVNASPSVSCQAATTIPLDRSGQAPTVRAGYRRNRCASRPRTRRAS